MNPFLRRVMERRLEEQMQAAFADPGTRQCVICRQHYRKMLKDVCGPCAAQAGQREPSRVRQQQEPALAQSEK